MARISITRKALTAGQLRAAAAKASDASDAGDCASAVPVTAVSRGIFAKLAKRHLKRGVFRSLVDLQAAINRFVAEHNQAPKPFLWRADPDTIIAARNRGFQTLESNPLA